jgi:eukaryotic-like serine/threonine-protein kinase
VRAPDRIDIANKYRLVRELGRGGMGAVYEATHIATGKRVAVKLMQSLEGEATAQSQILRFQREAMAVGQLRTPHVVEVYDAGVDPATGQPFLVMQALEGCDVSELLRLLGPLRPELAVAIVMQACAGLMKAHEAGIVHRDIKPSNLYLHRDEHGVFTVKVLDFGLAKIHRGQDVGKVVSTLTETGTVVGSPQYMSPEQAKGLKTADHRADLWSLGVVLHRCLSARLPFDGEALGQVIAAVCIEDPHPLEEDAPWVNPELAAIVRRALRRDPAARFADAKEMMEALRPHLQDSRMTETMFTPLRDSERSVTVRRSLFAGAPEMPSTTPKMPGAPEIPPRALLRRPTTPPSSSGRWRAPGAPPPFSSVSFVTPVGNVKPTTPKRKWPTTALVGTAAVIGVIFGVRALIAGPWTKPMSTRQSAGLVQPSAAAVATTTAPPELPLPAMRSESVTIAPPTARVEIDGLPARVDNGEVVVQGPLGSVHRVHLSWSGGEMTKEVILTDEGPRPAQLGLAPKAAAPRTGGRGKASTDSARAPASSGSVYADPWSH